MAMAMRGGALMSALCIGGRPWRAAGAQRGSCGRLTPR
eukprot:SAG22_NODE_13066_length_420_cov_0.906542_1_plen_37_part_01